MLNVYLGNFHPGLEDALCSRILTLKEDDPLKPVAIILPSDRIRSRIKTLLVRERGMDLMGVHFLTFHSLAARLYEEEYGPVQNLTGDEFFFIELIRHVLRKDTAGVESLRHFSETPRGCNALWLTILYMMEAKVEPDNVIEAVKEGLFSAEDAEKITTAILLYREFLSSKKSAGITDYQGLAEAAAELIPFSRYLQLFKEIIYYGFYDLTQLQYDLFRTVVQYYSTTLYFPLVDKIPAFSFSRRFYEGYIQGIVSESTIPPQAAVYIRGDYVPGLSRQAAGNAPAGDSRIAASGKDFTTSRVGSPLLFPFGHMSRIISTSGTEDELLATAKEILELVDGRGYRFSDIGVVARDIDSYAPLIKRIFDAHRIPFTSSAVEPVNRLQVSKALNLLLSIPEGDYRRSDVIDLAASHYCRIDPFCPAGIEPRPDIWDIVTRSLGITKGLKEWDRLDKYLDDGFILHEGRDDEAGQDQRIIGAEIEGIKRFVLSLNEDFSSLPVSSLWSDYVERFSVLIRKYLTMQDFIVEALRSLNNFNLISSEVTLARFIETLKRRLENMQIPVDGNSKAGVQVLDVMSARCIPFRALFVLGMNEKVFPRSIGEDPLLRDSARKVLESGLGYKITEKLYGYEEEKLLFYLLLSSASERIYILYQRTDDAGQIRIPSWYLSEMKRGHTLKEEKVPRRVSDKFASSDLFNYRLLTPDEMSIRFALEGRDPSPLFMKLDSNKVLYSHGIKSMPLFERMEPGLTGFDGITGPIERHWHNIRQYGISPTSLESYARCPFSYYARHVLGLRKSDSPEALFEIHPSEIGNICHKILKEFYMGYNPSDYSDIDIAGRLDEKATVIFAEFQQANPTGYPVMWEILQERLLNILKSFIEADIKELSSSGFVPYCFEVEAAGSFTQDVHEDLSDIIVHGVLDRIDIQPGTGMFRIIDYKYKSGKRAGVEDRNLLLSAVRGKRLQPPLYLLMAIPYLTFTCGIENPQPEEAAFHFIAPGWSNKERMLPRSVFPGDCRQSAIGDSVKSTIDMLLHGIKGGLFFIFPDTYCRYCDYSMICRKSHFPSRRRAERDERVTPYHAIRQKYI